MSNIKTAFYLNLTIPCFRVLNTFENFFSIYLKSVNAYIFSYLYLYNIKAETSQLSCEKLFHWFNATSNALRSRKSNWVISMICQCNDIFMLWPLNISDGARRTLIVLVKEQIEYGCFLFAITFFNELISFYTMFGWYHSSLFLTFQSVIQADIF